MKRVPCCGSKILRAILTIQPRRKHDARDVHLWNNRGLEKDGLQLLSPTQFNSLDYRFYE
jgi:hypothetical protein